MTEAPTIYLPPFLIDRRYADRQEVVPFDPEMAKNPNLEPFWGIPDYVKEAAKNGKRSADQMHKQACALVQKLHVTTDMIQNINWARSVSADQYGLRNVVEIGVKPGAKAKTINVSAVIADLDNALQHADDLSSDPNLVPKGHVVAQAVRSSRALDSGGKQG